MSNQQSKRRKRVKSKTKQSPTTLYYVALPLLGLGILCFLLIFITGKQDFMVGVILLGISGAYLTYRELSAPFKQKELHFDDDAIRAVRTYDKSVIGQIPYDNIATARVDELVIMGTHAQLQVEMVAERKDVVAICVHERDTRDTFWPFVADSDVNEFDYYIDKEFKISYNSLLDEFEHHMRKARLRRGN